MILAKLKKNNRYKLPTDDPSENIVYTITKMDATGIRSRSSKNNEIINTGWKKAMLTFVTKV